MEYWVYLVFLLLSWNLKEVLEKGCKPVLFQSNSPIGRKWRDKNKFLFSIKFYAKNDWKCKLHYFAKIVCHDYILLKTILISRYRQVLNNLKKITRAHQKFVRKYFNSVCQFQTTDLDENWFQIFALFWSSDCQTGAFQDCLRMVKHVH